MVALIGALKSPQAYTLHSPLQSRFSDLKSVFLEFVEFVEFVEMCHYSFDH